MKSLTITEILWCLAISIVFIGLSIFFSYLADNKKDSRIIYGITNSLSNVTGFIGAALLLFVFVIRLLPDKILKDLRIATGI